MYVIRRARGARFVRVRRRLRAAIARGLCHGFGHPWGVWTIDDMDGPGEQIGDDPEAFMPYLLRASRPGEYGIRLCDRCPATEVRWPADAAPIGFHGRWECRDD